uniref:Uncharacterized protein n=1 Tax=Meloidogyne incognita TaxID=6306 RepID=A0A914NUX6_MELIC
MNFCACTKRSDIAQTPQISLSITSKQVSVRYLLFQYLHHEFHHHQNMLYKDVKD